MKVIIAGGRDFSDYERLKWVCNHLIPDGAVIVSGGARGADRLGERYAKERGLDLLHFPADWNRYGRSAGMIRNKAMAEEADTLIAFWDGKSRGTDHMIRIAMEKGLAVSVIPYGGKQNAEQT